MPNLVTSQIFVPNVSPTEAKELHTVCKEQRLLAFLHPRPTDQDQNWYEWNTENWGTKWESEVLATDYCKNRNVFIVEIETAWSPPKKALQNSQLNYFWMVSVDLRRDIAWFFSKYPDTETDTIGELYFSQAQELTDLLNNTDEKAALDSSLHWLEHFSPRITPKSDTDKAHLALSLFTILRKTFGEKKLEVLRQTLEKELEEEKADPNTFNYGGFTVTLHTSKPEEV
tara:strand:- start:187 stop:870 length:684 start_codon:yes stop_codon:yes gene_type:complete